MIIFSLDHAKRLKAYYIFRKIHVFATLDNALDPNSVLQTRNFGVYSQVVMLPTQTHNSHTYPHKTLNIGIKIPCGICWLEKWGLTQLAFTFTVFKYTL